jgi:thioredoxin-related protein
MKNLLIFILCFTALYSNAQIDSTTPPYKRFPTLPPLQILLGDSTTIYTKTNLPKKQVLIMVFSPDCNHCQQTAEELLKYKEALKNIHIVMTTMYSISEINAFSKKYKLNTLPNLVIGKDIYFLLPPFYGIKSLPYMAFYKKNGNLIMGFEGAMSIPKVIEIFIKNSAKAKRG